MIWLFSLLTVIVSVLPILVGGLTGVFYSIDPEVMYVGNALSYIKTHQIQYIDHPGTPSILTVAFFLWPWRIYAKIIAQTPFVQWALANYDLIFFYLRLWQGIILGVGVWIFLKAVFMASNARLTIIFTWLAILVFTPALRSGSGITPESISFLMVSIWLWVLAKFLTKPNIGLIPMLGLISGLAVANKFSNLFLVLASASLTLELGNLSRPQKWANSIIAVAMAIGGFATATWPIRDKYSSLFDWIIRLLTSTGIHAGGDKAIFDLVSHRESLLAIYRQEPWLIIGVGGVLAFSLIKRQLRSLASIMAIGVFVFAKYPLSHYQLANYAILVFLSSILLGRLNKAILIIIILYFIPLIRIGIPGYWTSISLAISKTSALENFIVKNPAKHATLWEWGRAKNPAILWTTSNSWHGSIFAAEKEIMNLRFYELGSFPENMIFESCWDQLYIQKMLADSFIRKYTGRSLEYSEIPGNDEMILIKSDHCDSQGRR